MRLSLDPPGSPELPDQHTDTGFGKRSATLDLAMATDRGVFEELLASADVVVTGYRPGALYRFGLSPEALAERRPGLVVAQLSAWGGTGPWGARRGFDSLVRAATGIDVTEGAPDAQALDHGTGYLLAAAVPRALARQTRVGGTRLVRLALARTAAWLTDGGGGTGAGTAPPGVGRWLAGADSGLGRLRYALSPVVFDGGPGDWARPPGVWGRTPPGGGEPSGRWSCPRPRRLVKIVR